jgi:hypothetical protein
MRLACFDLTARLAPPRAERPFLQVPSEAPARRRIARYPADLDALPDGHPLLAFASWIDPDEDIGWSIARCRRSGAEATSKLALAGIMPPEMELNILNLIDRIEEQRR